MQSEHGWSWGWLDTIAFDPQVPFKRQAVLQRTNMRLAATRGVPMLPAATDLPLVMNP
jgi:hypothetical protein